MARKRKPIVAVVGRPNVGKSTLFNALAGEMISIVKDTPGITRDRIYADISWLDKNFTLIDTGGIEPDSGDIILSQMREQAQIAIDTADVILFMVDVKQGLVDADSKVADMLRRSKKPVILAVNKWRMSMSFIIWVSVIRGRSLRQTGWGSAICWTKLYVIFLKMQRWKRRMIVRKLRLSENRMSANRPLLTV